jgi:hypothetical protein
MSRDSVPFWPEERRVLALVLPSDARPAPFFKGVRPYLSMDPLTRDGLFVTLDEAIRSIEPTALLVPLRNHDTYIPKLRVSTIPAGRWDQSFGISSQRRAQVIKTAGEP